MSFNAFNTFAYNDSDVESPRIKNKSRVRLGTKRILLSSDEEDDTSQPVSTVLTSSSGSSPWLETRNPGTITSYEKSQNITAAVYQRKVIRSLIPKRLVPGMPMRETYVDLEDKKPEEVITADMKKIFSKSNVIRDSLLHKALDDDFDPFQQTFKKTTELRAKEREDRISSRAIDNELSTRVVNGKKRRVDLDSDGDDNIIDTPRTVAGDSKSNTRECPVAIDLTNSPTTTLFHGDKTKLEKVRETIVADPDDDAWSEGLTKAQLKSRASSIISQCEVVSKTLRKCLQQWEGNGLSTRIAHQESDCVNLIKMDERLTKGVEGSYSIDGRKSIVTEDEIAVCCPGLKLNGYQLVGVNWLKLLHENSVNGVLADDMGLGKTVQTIAFLGWLSLKTQLPKRDNQHRKRPHLIVVPASTLSNWQNEFSKFCPSLSVYTYHGTQNERTELRYTLKSLIPEGGVDVILSTYTIFEREACKQDRGFIYSQKFNFLILDEAHCIKNADSSRYANLNAIKTDHRLLLSGTPVQNDLSELLAMLSFLMPSVFGREDCELMMEAFGWQKGCKQSTNSDALSLQQLKSMLAPFVLRRLKRDVLDQLTEKTSELCLLDMSDMQKNIYEGIISRYANKNKNKFIKMTSSVDELGSSVKQPDLSFADDVLQQFSGSEAKHLFTSLRKAANHPLLLRVHYTDEKIIHRIAHKAFDGGYFGDKCTFDRVLQELENFSDYDIHQLCLEYSGLEEYKLEAKSLYDSPKMQYLRVLLPKLRSEGHRMLVFSQWTRLLDLLEILLQDMEMPFLRLDGSTPIADRQVLIDSYSNDVNIPVFLLSTKAGGLGINLTAADTVILHDLDFNPENDKQAEDRCHRIGQTKPVSIYRLVCKGTVDEDIFEMGQRKRQLSQAVLSDHRKSDCITPTTNKKKGGNGKEDDELNLISKILSKAITKNLGRVK